MNLVFFFLGTSVGAVICFLYLKLERISADSTIIDLESRVKVLEEQLSYFAARAEEALEPRPKQPRTRKIAPQTGKHDRVLSLYKEGFNCEAISRETGIPQGQVELMTRLYGRE